MKRVPDDLIEYSDDGVYCLKDQPFTGVGFSLHKHGWLEKEVEYRGGAEWGMKRQWYAPSELSREAQMRAGVVHGKERRWHRNGRLKEERECEFGVVLERKNWDDDGNLIDHYKLKETDSDFKTLQKFREIYKEEIEEEKRTGKE
jgi:antitoxin component YwqK of YwqJK toxin-antitoxin module